MPLSPRTQSLWDGIREKYIEAGYPGHRVWSFSPRNQAQRVAFGELQANGLIEPMAQRNFRLTSYGVRALVGAASSAEVAISVHHGDVVTSNISNSVVCANAVGTASGAEGFAVSGGVRTQERLRAALSEAQSALVQDQDRLDALDSPLFDALTQFPADRADDRGRAGGTGRRAAEDEGDPR